MSRNGALAGAIACVLFAAACTEQPAAARDAPAGAGPATAAPTTPAADATAAPAGTQPAPASADDATAFSLPGRFSPQDTVATLQARYGAANVQAGEVPGAEGERVEGVTLFPDDPQRRAYLYFDDDKAMRGLSMVRVLDLPSRWRLDDGIAIGMPLAELVRRNGKPITFYGLDWDYGGTISGWNGGKLENGPPPKIFRGIGLSVREDIGDAPYPTGDGEFSSDDPAFPNAGRDLVVGELSISFPDDDADADADAGAEAKADADAASDAG